MIRIHAIVVCLAGLLFATAFAMPCGDLPGTTYDESESQPYDCAPQVATVAHVAGAAGENLWQTAPAASAECEFASRHPVLAHTAARALTPSPATLISPIRC